MYRLLIIFILALSILAVNFNFNIFIKKENFSRLVCVSEHIERFSFGNNSQLADIFWIRFLQELDAFNELKVAESHLCPDRTSSWHYHLMKVAISLDSKFYEMVSMAPLLISITINDIKGASELFDKSVESFPNDWRILYRASYQAQIEEKNLSKAAYLLYRAGKNGAPKWVMSLAGGLYNETGQRKMAESIYQELASNANDLDLAERLKSKLQNKFKNHFTHEIQDSEDKSSKGD